MGFDLGDFPVRKTQLPLLALADFLDGGESDQRVAGADVEVDVGQRFDAEVVLAGVGFDLGDELEEEAQPADFDRLLHDVHAEEVVQND